MHDYCSQLSRTNNTVGETGCRLRRIGWFWLANSVGHTSWIKRLLPILPLQPIRHFTIFRGFCVIHCRINVITTFQENCRFVRFRISHVLGRTPKIIPFVCWLWSQPYCYQTNIPITTFRHPCRTLGVPLHRNKLIRPQSPQSRSYYNAAPGNAHRTEGESIPTTFTSA